MKINITGKKIRVTEGMESYIEKKFARLEKYLSPDAELKVTVSANKKEKQKVEVTLDNIYGHIIRAEDVQDDLYVAIDLVCDKLNRQIVKHKSKLKDKKYGSESIRTDFIDELLSDIRSANGDVPVEETDDNELVFERKKKFNLRPMSPEEAVLQMNLLGHDFFLFRDQDTFEVCLVYRRGDGGYGLIEQE